MGSSETLYTTRNESSTRSRRVCRQAATATPASATSASGPTVSHSRPEKATGVDRVVLEPEPAGLSEPLDAREIVPGGACMQDDERAREEERETREGERGRETPPGAERAYDERHDEQRAGVLRRRGEPGCEPGPLETSGDEQRERRGRPRA